ncbi:DNA polymerase, partial [Rappaport israeli]|uniref:DNA polymerase n=1 Tax=Rappaport israeli TaxID=1839807 RepID=UPI000A819B02
RPPLPHRPRLNLIMQVHDELVFEIQTDSIAPLQSDIIQRMQNAHPLNIPLIVEAGIGDNWDEAH